MKPRFWKQPLALDVRRRIQTLAVLATIFCVAGGAITPIFFLQWSNVRLLKADGTSKSYGFRVSTAAARGANLTSAITDSEDGDRIELCGAAFTVTAAVTIDEDVTIDGAPGWTAISRATTSFDTDKVADVTGDHVTFRGLKFTGTVGVDAAPWFTAEDCIFDGSSQVDAVKLDNRSHFVAFKNCYLTGGTRACLYVIRSNGTKVEGCTVDQGGQDGIYFDFDTTGNPSAGFHGCGAYNYPDDDAATGTTYHPPIVVGCHIINNTRFGIFAAYCHDLVVSGNNIERNGISQSAGVEGAGMFVKCPIQTTITGNEFERNGGVSSHSSTKQCQLRIQLDTATISGGAEFPSSACIVTGNHFGVFQHGIIADGQANVNYDLLIDNNQFHEPLGDSTNPSRAVWFQSYSVNYKVRIQNNSLVGRPTGGNVIANFWGIEIAATSDVSGERCFISGNVVQGVEYPIYLFHVDNVACVANHLRANTYGVYLNESESTILRNNIFYANVTGNVTGTGTYSYLAVCNFGLQDNSFNGWLTTANNAASADVTMTTAGTFYPAASITIGTGASASEPQTWLVSGVLNAKAETTNTRLRLTAKIWDATTAIVSATAQCPALGSGVTGTTSVSLPATPVTLTAATTYYIAGTGNTNAQVLTAATLADGSGNNACQITAVRVK